MNFRAVKETVGESLGNTQREREKERGQIKERERKV